MLTPFSCSTAPCSIRRTRASCCRASSTGWTAPTFIRTDCGEVRLIYRLVRTDVPDGGRGRGLAAAADDAQRRAESQGRSCDRRRRETDHLRRDRAALARRRRSAADGRRACGKTDRDGRPARSDPARKHRPHRDQSSDRACAEIRYPRFPHRLSDEGVRLRSRRRRRSSNRRSKTRSTATGSWPMQISRASSRRGCSSPRIFPSSIAAPS